MRNELICASVPGLPVHIGPPGFQRKGGLCGMHYHDEIELLAVARGRMTCTAAGKTLEIRPGDVAFINSRVPHSTKILEDGTSFAMLQINLGAFSETDVDRYLVYFVNSGENPFVLFPAGSPESVRLAADIGCVCAEFLQRRTAFELSIKAGVYSTLAFLYRNGTLRNVGHQMDRKSFDRMLPVLRYIGDHYQEDVTLERVSGLAVLNPYYFCRVFKRATGKTFTEYLNFVRISAAERLLSGTGKNVTEIALGTGFSSASYFNRTFRRLKNCSPTAYRKIKYAQK